MKAHGIMFHHFHDGNKHIVSQGSISSEEFSRLLDYYGETYNIISADEFLMRSEANTLQSADVCLTFDDGLRCQYDIALPVMKERGLTAFWFIYSSPLDGVKERIEIYRHFRFSMFSDIDSFYEAFFFLVNERFPETTKQLENFIPSEYIKECPFYTDNDRKFRYIRDVLLGEQKYYSLMDSMLIKFDYDIEKSANQLWLSKENIVDLHRNKHVIGLHSYSHPTVLANNDYSEQYFEYKKNKDQLESIIKSEIKSVSYPCNSYNDITLECMSDLGIKIGFRADMTEVCIGDKRLEYPREDHSTIIRKMEMKI